MAHFSLIDPWGTGTSDQQPIAGLDDDRFDFGDDDWVRGRASAEKQECRYQEKS